MARSFIPALVLGLAMVLSVFVSGSVLAVPAEQWLYTGDTVLCEGWVTNFTTAGILLPPAQAAIAVYGIDREHNGDDRYVYWGNASSSTVGTFGIARFKFALTDPVGELGAYYRLNVMTDGFIFRYPSTEYLSMIPGSGPAHHMSSRIGWGYSTPELGTYYQVGDWGPQEAGPTNWYEDINMTLESRPWSLAEVQAMYVEVDLRFDSEAVAQVYGTGGAIRQILSYVCVWAEPVAYTPPPEWTPTAGSFILRPDGDISSWAWLSTESTLTAAVNETYYHGDGDGSFINSTKSTAPAVFSLSDPPSWLAPMGRIYRCYPWAVAMTAEPIDPDHARLWVGLDESITHELPNIAPLQAGWYNHSVGPMLVGEGPYVNWSYADLVDAKLYIHSYVANVSITQLAVLCVLVDEVPAAEDFDFHFITDWLGGHGILTILGVMGLALMVAVPTMTVIQFREGDDDGFLTVVRAVCLLVLGFGLFLCGLI